MQIGRVEASYLSNIPITPPPLIKEPSKSSMVMLQTLDNRPGKY